MVYYWRVYSLAKRPEIDVRGICEKQEEASRQVDEVITVLGRLFEELPDDLARGWASGECEEWEFYHHLPHHPKMVDRARRLSVS